MLEAGGSLLIADHLYHRSVQVGRRIVGHCSSVHKEQDNPAAGRGQETIIFPCGVAMPGRRCSPTVGASPTRRLQQAASRASRVIPNAMDGRRLEGRTGSIDERDLSTSQGASAFALQRRQPQRTIMSSMGMGWNRCRAQCWYIQGEVADPVSYNNGVASTATLNLLVSVAAGIGGPGSPPVDLGSADDDVYLILFGTGLRFPGSSNDVRVTFGGTNVPVEYVGEQKEFAGLDQLNLKLPKSLAGRSGPLIITINGSASNLAYLSF